MTLTYWPCYRSDNTFRVSVRGFPVMTSLPVDRWYLLLLSLLFSFVIRPQEQSRQIINKCEKYNTTNKKVSANTKRILSHGEEQKTDRLNFKHSYSTESAENLQITNQTPVCYAKRSGKECGQYRASLGWWLILGYGSKRQGLCAKKCTIVISVLCQNEVGHVVHITWRFTKTKGKTWNALRLEYQGWQSNEIFAVMIPW